MDCLSIGAVAALTDPNADDAFGGASDAVASTQRGTPIQALVCNAGVILRRNIADFGAEDFTRQQQINATTPFLITQAVLPRLADVGRIVNISSGVTRIAFPEIVGYAMPRTPSPTPSPSTSEHVGSPSTPSLPASSTPT